MPSETSSERLSRLRSEADLSLRLYLQRTTLAGLTTTLWDVGGHRAASRSLAPSENPPGGMILPDNERTLRALAKEIKRLITEDKRRGLAV